MNQLFKFINLTSAKFVVERLLSMGIKAEELPSGYIRVFDLTEGAKKVIKDSLGTHVAATGVEDISIAKHAGKGMKEAVSSKPVSKKSTAPKISSESQKIINVQKMAYETLKRLVEKNPKGFPRLAKIMGIKVRS